MQKSQSLRADLERIRTRLGRFVHSMPGDKKLDNNYAMRVKGKALSSFLGHIKTDLPRLSIEAFPEHINKQLASLVVLPRCALIWFDL